MSRFISVLSDFILFDPKSLVCCCLCSFKVPETEISGITVNYKTLSIICVNPRQRNSGVQRCQILCRIRFYRSGRRNLPQFRGLQRFDVLDRGFPTPHFAENNPPPPRKPEFPLIRIFQMIPKNGIETVY